MEKSAEAFRTISEVAQDLDLPQHVLRFWEARFVQIKPLKRGGGRRYYRPEDVDLLRAIRQLLYGEGYTIKGVQKILREQGARAVATAHGAADGVPSSDVAMADVGDDDFDAADVKEAVTAQAVLDFSGTPHEPSWPDETPRPQSHRNAASDESEERFSAPADRAVLRELLSELMECTRILDAARGG